jgi:anti-sigma B factor antagonist
MQLQTSTLDNGILVAKLSGRLDLQGTLTIEDPFAFKVSSQQGHSLVDLSEVDFIASIGMRMLVKSAKAADNRGYQMGLLNAQPLVAEALQAAAIDTIIPMYDDLDTASSDIHKK